MVPGLVTEASSGQSDRRRALSDSRCKTVLWQIGVKDVIPPRYPTSWNAYREGEARRYVAAICCADFWMPRLIYLEWDGNEESLARLKAITDFNRSKGTSDVYILNYAAPLSESVVSALLPAEGERFRALLKAHLPAPFPDGWNDCNKWVLRLTRQFKRAGQLAMLPRVPPAEYEYLSCLELGWENYPDRLVSLCLDPYIRQWPTSAWRRVPAPKLHPESSEASGAFVASGAPAAL